MVTAILMADNDDDNDDDDGDGDDDDDDDDGGGGGGGGDDDDDYTMNQFCVQVKVEFQRIMARGGSITPNEAAGEALKNVMAAMHGEAGGGRRT